MCLKINAINKMKCIKKNMTFLPMNYLKTNATLPYFYVKKNLFHTCSMNAKSEEKPSEETVRVEDVLDDLKEPELTDEQILQKCFKSRLPERVHKLYIQKEPLPLETKYDLKHYRLRTHWAHFGSKTRVNPGICWPTREQILEKIEYNKVFQPSFQEKLRRVQERKDEDERLKKEYEAEVDKNMANHEKWLADYYDKIKQSEEKAHQLKLAREKLVEEISEYLGYDIDPKDPRFKEAVDQRNKEKKKEVKAKKQQESYERMLEKLKKIAQQQKTTT